MLGAALKQDAWQVTYLTSVTPKTGLAQAGAWKEAHAQREELMGCIMKWSGVGTLEDMRRFRDYDADKTVDRYLNQPAVKV